MVQRVISAFVYRDAELVQTPFQRAGGTLFIGAMIGIVALAAVGLYGVVVPGGKKTWRNDQALIMEKETGARYVYLNKQLHPVVNYVSARLILKKTSVSTVTVSRSSLKEAKRGVTLGITGIPDSLPDRKLLVKDPWVLCSKPGRNESGQAMTTSVLMIGTQPEGGRGLGEEAALIRLPDESVHMIWHDRRFRIRQPTIVLNALGLGQATISSATLAWANAIPQGTDIGPIDISNRGEASSTLANAKVGQVVKTKSVSGTSQLFVVLDDGIADITQLQADILLNHPDTPVAYDNAQPDSIERTDLARAKRSAKKVVPSGTNQPPPTTPRIVTGIDQAAMCASFGSLSEAPPVTVGATLSDSVSGVRPSGSGVDEVIVAPGRGVLVQSMQSADATTGPLALVTDLGIRYSLASKEVIGYLGYTEGSITKVPASLVALLAHGQALDPEAAALPVGTG